MDAKNFFDGIEKKFDEAKTSVTNFFDKNSKKDNPTVVEPLPNKNITEEPVEKKMSPWDSFVVKMENGMNDVKNKMNVCKEKMEKAKTKFMTVFTEKKNQFKDAIESNESKEKKAREKRHQEELEAFEAQEKLRLKALEVNDDDRPKAGVSAAIGADAIEILKNYYVPVLLKTYLDGPLPIEYIYDPIKISTVLLKFPELDADLIKIVFAEDTLKFVFPQLSLDVDIETELKTPIKKEPIKGNIYGNFKLKNVEIGLKFEKDLYNFYFKPRIILIINNFKLEKENMDLKTKFQATGFPDKAIAAVVKFVKEKIIGLIENYIHDNFNAETSTILNWVLDKYYPANVNLINDSTYLNLLLTSAPIASKKNEQLELNLNGEFFTNIAPADPDLHIPIPSEEEEQHYVMNKIDKSAFELVLTNKMLKFFLNTYFESQYTDIAHNYKFVQPFKAYKIDASYSKLEVTPDHIDLKGLKLNFYKSDSKTVMKEKNPQFNYQKNLEISLKLKTLDLVKGFVDIEITNLNYFDIDKSETEKGSGMIYNTYKFFTDNAREKGNQFIDSIIKKSVNGTYNFEPVLAHGTIRYYPIHFFYENGFVIAKSQIKKFDESEDEDRRIVLI